MDTLLLHALPKESQNKFETVFRTETGAYWGELKPGYTVSCYRLRGWIKENSFKTFSAAAGRIRETLQSDYLP